MVLVHTEKGSNLSEAKMSNFKFTHGEHHRYGITFVEKVIKAKARNETPFSEGKLFLQVTWPRIIV